MICKSVALAFGRALVGKLEVVPVSLVIVQDRIHNYIAPAFGSVCCL